VGDTREASLAIWVIPRSPLIAICRYLLGKPITGVELSEVVTKLLSGATSLIQDLHLSSDRKGIIIYFLVFLCFLGLICFVF